MVSPSIQLDSSDPACSAWNAAASLANVVLRCEQLQGPAALWRQGQIVRQFPDPLDGLRWLEEQATSEEPGQRWIGFLSYDLGRLFESVPGTSKDSGLPIYAFALQSLESPASSDICQVGKTVQPSSNFTPEQYRAAVRRVLEYIRAGDVFQVNLCQRFTVPQRLPAGEIYRRLLKHAPARFGGLLDFGDFALICNSPELFLRIEPGSDGSRRVVTRPIKGTRPTLPGMEAELLHSIKDQAELNMIVDLERNDLGRVCQIGSVKVTRPRYIETHPTVLHAAAEVSGLLRSDVTFVDLLAATFPGGSITGAPKIRAMQIIDELEPVRRGPYCGAIGWIGARGAIELNVAIRTMILHNGQIHIPVGGGIVADSDPQAEYDETLVKARAMFDALRISP